MNPYHYYKNCSNFKECNWGSGRPGRFVRMQLFSRRLGAYYNHAVYVLPSSPPIGRRTFIFATAATGLATGKWPSGDLVGPGSQSASPSSCLFITVHQSRHEIPARHLPPSFALRCAEVQRIADCQPALRAHRATRHKAIARLSDVFKSRYPFNSQ